MEMEAGQLELLISTNNAQWLPKYVHFSWQLEDNIHATSAVRIWIKIHYHERVGNRDSNGLGYGNE